MSITIPKVGLGTYLISNQELKQCIPAALKAGYRHFDTAQVYENEKGIGLSLAKSLSDQNISRKNIFITMSTYYIFCFSIFNSLNQIFPIYMI